MTLILKQIPNINYQTDQRSKLQYVKMRQMCLSRCLSLLIVNSEAEAKNND